MFDSYHNEMQKTMQPPKPDTFYKVIFDKINALQPAQWQATTDWIAESLTNALAVKNIHTLTTFPEFAESEKSAFRASKNIPQKILQKVISTLVLQHETWSLFQVHELRKIIFDRNLEAFILFPFSYEAGAWHFLLIEKHHAEATIREERLMKAAMVYKQLQLKIETWQKTAALQEVHTEGNEKQLHADKSVSNESADRYQTIIKNLSSIAYSYRYNHITHIFHLDWIEGMVEIMPFKNLADNFDLEKYLSVIHPDDIQEVLNKEEQIPKRKSYITNYRIKNSSSNYIWVKDYNWYFGEVSEDESKFYGIIQNIQDDINRENQISLLWTAISHTANMILIVDEHQNIEFVNPAFTIETGLQKEQVTGRPLSLFSRQLETNMESAEMSNPASNVTATSHKITYKNPEGVMQTALMTRTPVMNLQGGIHKWIILVQNITRLNELEKQLLQRDKLSTLGLFSNGIAHDFNNILQIIKTYTDLLQMKSDQSARSQELFEQLNNAIQRGTSMASNLLYFGKPTSNQRRLWKVSDLLKKTIQLLHDLVPPRIQLKLELVSDCSIMTDETAIVQMVTNLVINALQAISDKGEIVVRAELVEENYQNRAEPLRFAIISVKDNGSGIPPEIIEKIFQPYFSTKSMGDGTGLGLAIVQSIVNDHHGSIHVTSNPETGTSFVIRLPAIDEIHTIQ